MINNSLFKITEIPDFHPLAEKYERREWWREQKRRCIEGYWVGGKWMPPELYYYVNFHTILFEEGVNRGMGFPWLRDIDWEKSYIYTEATGFSGFQLDDKFSCHRGLFEGKEYMSDEDILKLCTNSNTQEVNKLFLTNFYDSTGKRKTYVPASEYLKKIHNGDLGKPLYLNQAKHVFELASRGYGKSYSASGLIAHNFLFDGARDYDLFLAKRREDKPLQSETVVGAIDTKFSSKLISKVKVGLEKLPGSKVININGDMTYFPSPLMPKYSGSFAVGREVLSDVSKSNIQHVTFADNPFAASGGRPNKIFIDEVGFMNNILETWEAIENTQASAEFKRLTIYGMGTGGLTSGGAVTYTQKIFYNPEHYNCLAFEDKWEGRDKKIGYFVSGVYALNKYKEGPNLITNEEKALTEINRQREEAKATRSSSKIQGAIINKPLLPSEIFLRMEGTFFPVHELKETLANLEKNTILLNSSYKAELRIVDGKVVIYPSNLNPIRDYPLTKNDYMDACIEIFERPKTDTQGVINPNRYVLSVDPVDDDGNDDATKSLQSTHVLDTWTNRIVAEYTARTYLAETYYENVRKLAMLYNGLILYENNKKGLYGHFKNKNSLWMLAETPQILKDQEVVKSSGIGNRALGVNVTDRVKIYGINLILKWLDAPSYTDPEKKNLTTIRSVALLKELISFSLDVNADRVSSLLVLMIMKEELGERITETMKQRSKKTGNDMFWGRAYKDFSHHKVYNTDNKYQ